MESRSTRGIVSTLRPTSRMRSCCARRASAMRARAASVGQPCTSCHPAGVRMSRTSIVTLLSPGGEIVVRSSVLGKADAALLEALQQLAVVD